MKAFFAEFKEFAVRGSVVDLAIGLIIGSAFGTVVTSFVNDILMPPLGLLLGSTDFRGLFINLGSGDFDTLAQAREAGAPTINYGMFINAVVSFILTLIAVYFVVRLTNHLRRESDEEPAPTPGTRPCPHCLQEISQKADKCSFCTADISPALDNANV